MATKLYLTLRKAEISRARNDNNKAGSASGWAAHALCTTESSTASSTSQATVAGPTSGLEFLYATGVCREWISPPLAAAATISGTITFGIYGNESSMSANASMAVIVSRVDNLGAIVGTVTDSLFGTELGTGSTLQTWTATPTSTGFNKGDRIRVVVYYDDATATTMGSGYTVNLNNVPGSPGSYVQFNETLTFLDCWRWLVVQAVTWNDVYCAAGTFYLLAGLGKIYYGTTQANMAAASTPDASTYMYVMAYDSGTGKYVAGGLQGGVATRVWTSTNGTTWSNTTYPGGTWQPTGLAYKSSNTTWVLVGQSANIWSSTNGGANWSAQTGAGGTPFLYALACDGTTFVAMGTSSTIWTSTNGVTWGTQTAPRASCTIKDILWANNLFVAVGYTATNAGVIWTSPDGAAWTERLVSNNPNNWATAFSSVCYDTRFGWYVVDYGGTGGAWSADGVNWLPLPGLSGDLDNQYLCGVATDSSTMILTVGAGTYSCVTPFPGGVSAVTPLFLTAAASDIADQGDVEKKIWSSRGTG